MIVCDASSAIHYDRTIIFPSNTHTPCVPCAPLKVFDSSLVHTTSIRCTRAKSASEIGNARVGSCAHMMWELFADGPILMA